jgi:hypothetical protein
LDSPRPPGQFFLDLESAASAWPSASRSPRHHRIVRLTSSTGCSSSEGAITGLLWFGGGGVYGMGEAYSGAPAYGTGQSRHLHIPLGWSRGSTAAIVVIAAGNSS